ncbi:MAG: DNA recombination protein RmuC [Propionibacteriaceae bacterium]
MDAWRFIFLLAGALIGVLAAWFILRYRENRQSQLALEAERSRADADTARAWREAAEAKAAAARASADTERLRSTAAQAREEAALAREEAADARAQLAATQARVSGAHTELATIREAHKKLTADREFLVNQFTLLSHENLQRQQEQGDAIAQQRLQATEQLLAPMNEALKAFHERLNGMEKERVELQAELRGEVRAVQKTGDELRRETAALANALRKPQVRGAWGETQLRRVAELAGMKARCDFDEQQSVRTELGIQRPDMTVNLADGRKIFVDSKAPLAAWLDAGAAESPEEQTVFITNFGRAIRTHIDQLGSKQYFALAEGSPDFVILFLPGENFLQAAFESQPDLYEYALRRNVVIATPNTLIALLRTVALGWRQSELAANAQQVLKLGQELYDRLTVMGSAMAGLGENLERTVKAYNKTVGSLESRVLVTARRFTELSLSDKTLVEPLSLEIPVRELRAAELLSSSDTYSA